jgi:flagellar biosynthesis/type III secretory pathway protein FliH
MDQKNIVAKHASRPIEAPDTSQAESAYQRGYLDGMAKGRRQAECDAADSQATVLSAEQERERFESWLDQGNRCGCNENMRKAWNARAALYAPRAKAGT